MTLPEIVGEEEHVLSVAAAILEQQGAIVLPTDTVYGVAVLAQDERAVDRLFALKQRPKDLSIAVLVADRTQAETIAELSEVERRVAEAFWPGPLTLVLHRRTHVGEWIGRDDGTVGVRSPARSFVRQLAKRCGPLATTSANLSGHPTADTAIGAAGSLAGTVALVIDGGRSTGEPSTVARIAPHGQVIVLRPGPINAANLEEIAQNLH